MDVPIETELGAMAFVPSRAERALAAAAHLSLCTGLWMIAPLAIYATAGRRSRLVGFHALQAALLQLFCLAAFGLLALVLSAVLWLADSDPAVREEVGSAFVTFAVIAGGCGLSGVQLTAAFAAWRGVLWPIPLVGEIAETLSAPVKPPFPAPPPGLRSPRLGPPAP